MAFRGKSTHTPVSNPSPMICKETHWLPRVNYGIIMSQFVAGTLGKGMDVVCLLLCWGHKGSCSQRTQEPGMLNNTQGTLLKGGTTYFLRMKTVNNLVSFLLSMEADLTQNPQNVCLSQSLSP